MSPIDKLRSAYQRYSPHRSLEEDVGTFIRCHYLFATPHFVALGKPVKKGADKELIIQPGYVFPVSDADTWFLFAYAGRIMDLFAFIPFELRWLAWERRGACLRYWTLEQFKQRCTPIHCRIAGWQP